jgi:hypothetical protein
LDLVLAAAFRRQADCVVWDEDSAAFLALAGAVAAKGDDLVAVEQGVEDGGGEDGIAERSVRRWAILTAIPMRRPSLRAISSSTRKAKASKGISRRAASSIRQSSWSRMAANCSRVSQPASGGALASRRARIAPRRIGDRLPKSACVTSLHRVVSNRRFHRSPGLSSSPKT